MEIKRLYQPAGRFPCFRVVMSLSSRWKKPFEVFDFVFFKSTFVRHTGHVFLLLSI